MELLLKIFLGIATSSMIVSVLMMYNYLVDTRKESVPTREMLGFVRILTLMLVVILTLTVAIVRLY